MEKELTEANTEAVFLAHIKEQQRLGRSLREIANDYGKPILHTDIQRALKGIYPVGVKKRLALGLPAQAKANVCRVHGIVHQYDCQHDIVKTKKEKPAWLLQAVEALAKLEAATPPDRNRVYDRLGRRVRIP